MPNFDELLSELGKPKKRPGPLPSTNGNASHPQAEPPPLNWGKPVRRELTEWDDVYETTGTLKLRVRVNSDKEAEIKCRQIASYALKIASFVMRKTGIEFEIEWAKAKPRFVRKVRVGDE